LAVSSRAAVNAAAGAATAAANRAAVIAVGRVAIASAGGAALVAGRTALTAAGVAAATCLADLLAELISLLFWLLLLPVWLLALLLLLGMLLLSLLLGEEQSWLGTVEEPSIYHLGLPSLFLLISPLRIIRMLAALRVHMQRICTGEVEVLIATTCLKNQSGPGACSNTMLVLCLKARGSRTKNGK
jgi:hypothetical protein